MTGYWFESSEDINSYLGYRSIPGPIQIDDRVLEAAKQSTIHGNRSRLVEQGRKAISNTFAKLTTPYDSSVTHVVPLSGGIDSRTILGGVLDNVDRDQVVTVTFGTPGAYDFEIGQKVADHAGVKNYAIDLTPGEFPWTEERLLASAGEYTRPTVLFRARTSLEHAFEEILDVDDPVYWSGFMGDAVAGGHLPKAESETWSEAIENFLPMNLKCPHLTDPAFDPISVLPDGPTVDRDRLSFDEQLDFGVRQPYFIRPSAVYKESFETPYIEEPLLSFFLNVSREFRVNRSLFKEIVAESYPALYQIPTETMEGLTLDSIETRKKGRVVLRHVEERLRKLIGWERPSRSTQHLDWNYELRNSEPLQTLVLDQLNDLDERQAVHWLDCCEMYEKHQGGADLGRELKLLTSLEIFLKVKPEKHH